VTSLDDMIEIHRQLLVEAAEACRSLPAEIEKYVTTVSSLPQAMVKLRLIAVQGLIRAYENALRAQHKGKGYIFIQAGNNMLSVCWSELDLLGGKTEKPSSGESVFFAVDKVLEKIEEFISQVDSGDLLPAINWLNRHENVNIDRGSRLP
jgi:hypothetical protein